MTPQRSAIVVGGASGIGAAIARALAKTEYLVTVADRDGQAASSLAAELGPDHGWAKVEITHEDQVEALFASAGDPGPPLHLVVNCVGILALGMVTEQPVEKFRRVVDVCLTGSFLVMKHAPDRLQDGGSIISMSSLNARQPGVGMGAYCAAKAGLSMLTEVAALELAPWLRVNAIAPGLIRTPLTSTALGVPGVEADYLENIPLGRPGSAEEIAEAVLYLSDAQWITGEVLDLNGGAHMMRYPNVREHYARAQNGG